jgi:uncharacterized protein (DUF2252 family)
LREKTILLWWSMRLAGKRDGSSMRLQALSKRENAVRPPISRSDRRAEAKSLRKVVPRSSHGVWRPPPARPDPVALLEASSEGRLPRLIPLRYGRMLHSPFTFFRGAASIMAADLATTPVTGLRVQACGDCHLLNFGEFATPERNLTFDLNDFDETLPAPWEWDVKRCATSVAIAGRAIGLRDRKCRAVVSRAVRAYREAMAEFARMCALDVWYARLDARTLVRLARHHSTQRLFRKTAEQARAHTVGHVFPHLTEVTNGQCRIADEPPRVFYPPHKAAFEQEVRSVLAVYRETLPDERRVLLDRYHFVDAAMKVVGVGSVGTRCAVALLLAADNDPLFLQIKEARPSVLEPYAGPSGYAAPGQRIVVGQHLMQAASDIFLGWAHGEDGRSYYVRQLRDMKAAAHIDLMSRVDLAEYARFCAWALARAHARSGDAARIAGYLGKSDRFDRAVADFAIAYANQNEADYTAFMKAVRAGRLHADVEVRVDG